MTANLSFAVPNRWLEPPRLSAHDLMLADHPLLAAILYVRGIRSREEADEFLSARHGTLSDPALLPDMERAVPMLLAAIKAGKRIAIFGDYDVDGLTSTAMLTRVLRRLGADVIPLVPHRIRDGYGVTPAAIQRIIETGAEFVIAVDCGSSSASEFATLLAHGIPAIVLDHHHYAGELPSEVAYVSAKRPDSRFPFPDLAGVGVAYMLVRLLLGDDNAEMYLPYVAMGSVADVVDLRSDNRVLVTRGIAKLRRWTLPAIIALCQAAEIKQAELTTWHLGFVIGPRINAAGRMSSPQLALDLLLADTLDDAIPLAQRLNQLNTQRKTQTQRVQLEAERHIESDGPAALGPVIVVADRNWSTSIAGLVASRLTERYGRPAVVLEQGPSIARGSARSIPGVNIVEAIAASEQLLERYGGHAAAAGLSLRSEFVDQFRNNLAATVLDMCGGRLPEREIQIDAEAHVEDLELPTVNVLRRLEPFGHGNEQPLLIVRNLSHQQARTTADGRHIQMRVVDRLGRSHRAVFFGAGSRIDELLGSPHIDIVTTLERDVWNGQERLQLALRDFRKSPENSLQNP